MAKSWNWPRGMLPHRYLVALVLASTYMLNFVDRQLLAILAEPIRHELGLSDTQLGMLTGLTFALFYTFFGIPVAMIADRGNRIRLIAVACGVWSLFTILSGTARSFAGLALARIGVGIGEAGCSPPAYSILSDYFPPEERGRAFALYVLGVPLGSFIGTLAGGWIAAEYGWRMAFFLVGGVGLLFAPLLPLLVREPARGRFDSAPAAGQPPSLGRSFAYFWRSRLFVLTAAGCGLTAFCGNALLSWAPAYLTREQGMTLKEVGTSLSFGTAIAMIASAWAGAWIADRAAARNPIQSALLPGVAICLAAPFLLGFTLAGDWLLSSALLVPAVIFTSIYLVPALALLQNRTPADARATVGSILLFLINLVGLGGGPVFVGALSDLLSPTYGAASLGAALRWLAPFALLACACQMGAAWLIHKEGSQA